MPAPKILILLGFTLVLCSCIKDNTGTESSVDSKVIPYIVQTHAVGDGTKTHIAVESTSSTSLSWDSGDIIGLNIGDIQRNVAFRCISADDGEFEGYLPIKGEKVASVEYTAYYPYSRSESNEGIMTGNLPKNQVAPYDPLADYMISDAITARYDEDNMPELDFSFGTHLFAIVKFSFVNTDPALADETISEIRFTASGQTLSGSFTFDPADKETSPTFSTVAGENYNRVVLKYSGSSPVLGEGIQHSVYAVINPIDVSAGGFKISVVTENSTSTFTSSVDLSFSKNHVTVLPLLNLSASSQRLGKRTIVLWGDSITNETYLAEAQKELGVQWNVVRGGVPGDSMYGIACRQGSLPLRNRDSFTIPSDESYVTIGKLYYGTSKTALFQKSYYNNASGPLINPVVINGIEGDLYYDADGAQWKFKRSVSGASCIVEPDTYFQTFASRTYRNADLISIYMGANGGPEYGELLSMHNTMKAFTDNHEVIVMGYSMDISLQLGTWGYWSEEYVNLFTNEYGRRFIDQRTEGSKNAYRLLVETGVVHQGDSMSADDQAAVAIGDWPESFFTSSSTNVHPNAKGNKVMAILLRERMEELGYLD